MQFLFFNFIQFLFILFSWRGRGAPGKCTRSPWGSAEHRLGTSGLGCRRFEYRQRARNFRCTKTSTPDLGPTQPSIQFVQ